MSFRSMKLRLQGFVPELSAVQLGLRINHSYMHLLDLHPWSFLKSEYIVATNVPYTTGTIDVNNASTSVVGFGTVWTGMENRFIRVGTDSAYYKIATIVGIGMLLTLEQAYEGTTTTGASYSIFQPYYNYPTDCKNIINIRYQHKLPERTKQFLDALDPDRRSTGQPTFWAHYDDDTFEVWPVPSAAYALRVHYNRKISELTAEADVAELSESLLISHAVLACYRQLAARPEGQHYAGLIQPAIRDFSEFWSAAIEEDMRKLSLPTVVRTPGLYEFPQDNESLYSHDYLDPRGGYR